MIGAFLGGLGSFAGAAQALGMAGGANALAGALRPGGLFGGNRPNPMSGLNAQGNASTQYTPATAVNAVANTVAGPSRASLADEQAMRAQRDALDLTRANTSQGFNRAESDNLNLGINRVNQNTAARSNAIAQQSAARGLGGSGLDAALKASAEQGGANAASNAGIEAQNSANQRALGSISQLGNLGAQINQQEFNRGQAQDAFNQWNAGAQNQFALANQAAQNNASIVNAGGNMQNQQFNQGQYQQGNQFQQQMQMANQQQNVQLLGSVLGAAGAAFGCWVAAEVFGGWYHPMTVRARHYVNFQAPKWFKKLYLKYGERFAKYISDKPKLKAIVKPLFVWFASMSEVQ